MLTPSGVHRTFGRAIVIFTFLLLPQAMDGSEATRPESKGRVVVNAVVRELRRYGSDSLSMLRAPRHWDQEQWTRAAMAAGAVAAAAAVDEDVADLVQRNRNDVSEDFSDIVTPFGGRRALNISGAILVGGLVTRNPKLRDTGRDAIEASILAGWIVTPVLKRAVGRMRPFENEGAFEFDTSSKSRSFPSGHATNAFAVASVVAGHSDGWVVPAIAYTLATGVAGSRMNDDVHFGSDVIAGAAIGTAIGRAVVARHRPGAATSKIAIEVMPVRGGVAIQFQTSSASLLRRLRRH
ncbi:MAG: phosphatase PAP2 family protein [Acidobacteriota bacterium]|nr:phosphatase PAP2 family protein [Acidobacteriota bacterium]